MEIRAVDTKIFESVRVIEFHKLQAKIDQIKINIEGEMDQLQVYVRDSKDKTAELVKKFKLIVDKLTERENEPDVIGNALHVVEHKFPEFGLKARPHGDTHAEEANASIDSHHHHDKKIEKSPGLKKLT